MVIKRIRVCDFGAVDAYETALTPTLNLLDIPSAPELSVAISFLLGSLPVRCIPAGWVRPTTRLTADIRVDGALYTVCAFFKNEGLRLVAEKGGKTETKSYLGAVRHCQEQDDTEFFDGRNKSLSTRLFRYRERENSPALPRLSLRTARFSDTQTFRTRLNRYIADFQPEPINNPKPYQLILTAQGKFDVRHPDWEGKVFLSTTEERLFQYLCFLNLAEFWEDVERIRDLHHEKKPLLIQNFLEYLDESTDISGLLTRTLKLQRQVIIFSCPLQEEVKHRWLTHYNQVRQKGA